MEKVAKNALVSFAFDPEIGFTFKPSDKRHAFLQHRYSSLHYFFVLSSIINRAYLLHVIKVFCIAFVLTFRTVLNREFDFYRSKYQVHLLAVYPE